ncbi:MAG: glycoside hydrolase family 2 TIM barrel-domain containing protein [Ruthenibacterium sp.]
MKVDVTSQTDCEGIAQIEVTSDPILWDCYCPRLYQIKASISEHEATDCVGFRELNIEENRILLNGNELFLKGVCCHEESKLNGRALTDAERQEILTTAKELGCNMLRLSHYPHSEKMAQLADQMGMLLWEEIPVYWALDFENPSTYENATNQMRELILRDRNRASVAIWSVGNENPDSDARLKFMTEWVNLCKKIDPSRFVSAACLVDIDKMCVKDRLSAHVDIVAFNEYYGWYYRDYEGLAEILDHTVCDKPLVISETGAGSKCGNFGTDEELFSEEHQAKMYEKQFAMMDKKAQGVFPWILFDFRSPVRMNAFQQQHNIKGLAALNHKDKKLAFYMVQKYYQTK